MPRPLYFLLRLLVRLALWVFYRRFTVRNRPGIPATGPLIIAANHPNTFMDPLAIAALAPRPVYFLTNSGVFTSKLISRLLRGLNMIPVYRRSDGEDAAKNEETFRECFRFLAGGGCLLIFPEGSSIHERRLRPLKTGTARIALGAEASQNWALGLQILPIGLTYSDPTRFRSELFVNIGQPLRAADWADAYHEEAFGAARQLTDHLTEALQPLVIHTRTADEESLLERLETVYRHHLAAQYELGANQREEDFLLSRGLAESIAWFSDRQPERVRRLRELTENYLQDLERLALDENIVAGDKSQPPAGQATILLLILGLPFWLYGLITNYLPYILPSLVADRLTRDREFRAPIMMTTGIFTFPLFYALQIWLFHRALDNAALTWLYGISLPLSGFFTLGYELAVRRFRRGRQWREVFRRQPSRAKQLLSQRQQLLAELEMARQEYLAATGGVMRITLQNKLSFWLVIL